MENRHHHDFLHPTLAFVLNSPIFFHSHTMCEYKIKGYGGIRVSASAALWLRKSSSENDISLIAFQLFQFLSPMRDACEIQYISNEEETN